MASGSILKDERNGRWMARWRDPSGTQRKKSFDRKLDAQRFLNEIQASLHRGHYVDLTNKVTLAQYAQQWLAVRPPMNDRTQTRLEYVVRKHIVGTPLGGRLLVNIKPSEVQGWVASRTTLSPASLQKTYGRLKAVFASAVDDKIISSSPCVRISLPKAEPERVVPLTIDQVRALIAVMPDRFQAAVLVQACLGLRVGEVFGLRVHDVDWLRKTVRVERQSQRGQLVEPKTASSRRTIPMPAVVGSALAAHLARHPASQDDLIFHTARDRAQSADTYRERWFGPAVKAAGLPAGTGPHDLRHHYASVMLAAGEGVVDVAAWLGHDNATLVLSTYGHLMPGRDARARAAIDSIWCATGVPQLAPESLRPAQTGPERVSLKDYTPGPW